MPDSEGSRGQRRRPDDAAARERTSARPGRRGVRCHLHHRQAHRLRLPRLPLADSPADLPADESRNLHVRGYKEEGTTTTPFDMTYAGSTSELWLEKQSFVELIVPVRWHYIFMKTYALKMTAPVSQQPYP